MLAHKNNLASPAHRVNFRHRLSATSSAELPTVPAMAASIITLQILLAEYVADLEAITQVIRADVGLTVHLLRSASLRPGLLSEKPMELSHVVVDLGRERLKKIVAAMPFLGYEPQLGVNLEGCGSFWLRARQTARTAEQVASQVFPELAQTAYLAGLLHHLGELPALLGWSIPGLDSSSPREIGCRMAQSWGLPELLVDVIGGDEQACRSRESQWLLRLINAAEPAVLHG